MSKTKPTDCWKESMNASKRKKKLTYFFLITIFDFLKEKGTVLSLFEF